MSTATFTASLHNAEAVLRFPYDERLRLLLRTIPGRRWDPQERAWCVPLAPEQAQALTRLFASLPQPPQVSEQLRKALSRERRRRRSRGLLLELARPDESWWLSFATDAAGADAHGAGARAAAARLLEHPGARVQPTLGRALVPLDECSAQLVRELLGEGDGEGEGRPRAAGESADAGAGVELSAQARRALEQLAAARGGHGVAAGGAAAGGDGERAAREDGGPCARYDVELRRDRGGRRWIMVAPERARLAQTLAARGELPAREGPAGTLGLAALEDRAHELAQLLEHVEDVSVDPRVSAWLERACSWRGHVEVQGPPERPVFVLLGEQRRLPGALRALAASVPGGAEVPLTAACWRHVRELDGWLSPAARRCVAAIEAGRPAPAAVLELWGGGEEALLVLEPGHDAGRMRAFAALPGAIAAPQRAPAALREARRRAGEEGAGRRAALRADPFCVPQLDQFLADGSVWVAPDALALLQELREQHARAAGLVALSAAREAPLRVFGLGGELKPFQRAGVSYLLARRRAFLADEQGLGKTIEALAALQAADAFPAVVVCPASLKLNWVRELERWLPGRSVRTLAGTGAASADGAADVTVLNYEIVAARMQELCACAPRALVLDESHYCKNPSAKRTQAVQRLAAAVPADGLVLALSGTPVMNRPAELIAQLRILGRLEEFGSPARFSQRFRGADAHLRLHWHLRARCFVRRLKAEVLPQLPAKTRSVVPVELDNELEYRLAERDLVAWLRSQPLDLRELDAKVAAALRAERLVRCNALKLLAARGKLHAALAWMHDFCSSGERLVVFAGHREIQRAVLARFPGALHVLGEDGAAARDAAVRAFQEPDDGAANQLIVCSTDVAGHGLTLTRSSNVAFLELDWTPAKHDQAEDRCHRIGQQDAVNAYYLLAAGTIDETISSLLERKRAVIGAVTDGREREQEGVLDGLVRELRGAPYRHLRAVA
ncbi:MAG TPA: SNF2-related protein [Solirubrobacteraceae bacterium]|nr:SNF2-related protein [Solirubrobacteraceae bacterium]